MTGRSLERRDFLKRGAVFGAAAAGAALGPWTSPSVASMSPPAALEGSGGAESNLDFDGPGEVHVWLDQTMETQLHFQIIGQNLFGSYNLNLVPPTESVAGLTIDVSMSPAVCDFTGGTEEVHNVFVNWEFSGDVPEGLSQPLSYILEATPADPLSTETATKQAWVVLKSAS